MVQFLETYNFVVLLTANPDAIYSYLETLFTPVVAAGGVVENSRGEWLFIHRNNRWDLPKGHLEPGEELEVCATREIEEETGVAAEVVAPICTT
ncbi:MAG: NUDIX domain-containing protein [Alistipes sp.]|nr:NUDIX domain-containing protein [Alistipes sp.]